MKPVPLQLPRHRLVHALLEELTAQATQRHFVYRHAWREGHRGTAFDDMRHARDMRRTTVLER